MYVLLALLRELALLRAEEGRENFFVVAGVLWLATTVESVPCGVPLSGLALPFTLVLSGGVSASSSVNGRADAVV